MAKRMKEKAAFLAANKDRRPRAVAKYVRISSSKVNQVLGLIRGKDYNDAMAILYGTPKGSSEVIMKVLASAGANAENNLNMSKSDLYVAEAYANQGVTMKRWWPRSHGSADTILKRTCHITIILDERKKEQVTSKKVEVATTKVDEPKVDQKAKTKVEAKAAEKTKAEPKKATAKTKSATAKTTKTVKPVAEKKTTTKTTATKKVATKSIKGGEK